MNLTEAIVVSVEKALQGDLTAARNTLRTVRHDGSGSFEHDCLLSWCVDMPGGRSLNFPTSPDGRFFDEERLEPGRQSIRANRILRRRELEFSSSLDIPIPALEPGQSQVHWHNQLAIAVAIMGAHLMRHVQRVAIQRARSYRTEMEAAEELTRQFNVAHVLPPDEQRGLLVRAREALRSVDDGIKRALKERDEALATESQFLEELNSLARKKFHVSRNREAILIEAIDATVNRCGVLAHPGQAVEALWIAYRERAQFFWREARSVMVEVSQPVEDAESIAYVDRNKVHKQRSSVPRAGPSRATLSRLKRKQATLQEDKKTLNNQRTQRGKHRSLLSNALIVEIHQLEQGPTSADEWREAQHLKTKHCRDVERLASAILNIENIEPKLSEESAKRKARRWLKDPTTVATKLRQAKLAAAEMVNSSRSKSD